MPKTQIATSEHLPEWLHSRRVSLAATTYQTHRLFLVGVKDDGGLSGFERLYDRPMGLYAEPDASAVHFAERYQIRSLVGAIPAEARESGDRHEGYDQVYVPRTTRITGELDAHEIGRLADGRLVFVNTKYSCLATPSGQHSFEVLWTPPFISKLAAEDRCHLNGLAMENGVPRYVTAASRSDVAAGWRDRREAGGVVIDVESGEIVCTGLSMPHSPRLVDGRLWLINAGTGELGTVDIDAGRFEPVAFLPGFGRGLAIHDGLGIVGLSKPRRNRAFEGLALDERLKQKDADARCGLWFVDLKTGVVAHWLEFTSVVEELFDVAVLPGVRRPMALGFKTNEIQRFITFRDTLAPTQNDGAAPLARHQIALKEEVQAAQNAGDPAPADTPGTTALPSFELPRGAQHAQSARQPATQTTATFQAGMLTLDDALARFEPLVPKSLKRALKQGRQHGGTQVLGIVAALGVQPIGLALTRTDDATQTSTLVSVYVEAARRGRGLGSALVAHAEAAAKQRGAASIQASYLSDVSSVAALERVFAKRGWGEPKVVRRHFKAEVAAIASIPPYDRVEIPENVALFPWPERTEADDAALAVMLPEVPRAVDPYQLANRLDEVVSLGARVDGMLAAWLLVHRLSPSLNQYTALYVHPRFRSLGLGVLLNAACLHRQRDLTEVSDYLFAVEAGNALMERAVDDNPESHLIMQAEVRLVGKRL